MRSIHCSSCATIKLIPDETIDLSLPSGTVHLQLKMQINSKRTIKIHHAKLMHYKLVFLPMQLCLIPSLLIYMVLMSKKGNCGAIIYQFSSARRTSFHQQYILIRTRLPQPNDDQLDHEMDSNCSITTEYIEIDDRLINQFSGQILEDILCWELK